jgi:DNA-binding NtrC family response regulator
VPQSVQTMLLRVLQEREVVRLGENRPRKIDVRVVVATHHDLADDVSKGVFRADLLYRVRVARIHLAPLRQRRQDLPLLAAAFLREFRAATGKRVEDFTSDAMSVMLTYDWPGNVRELRGAIEFAVIRAAGTMISAADWPPEVQALAAGEPALPALPSGADEAQRILAALEQSRGNRVVAARLLGMSRATLYRRLTELDVPAK